MALLLTLPSDEQRPCYFQRSLDVTGFPGGSAVENRLPIQETSVPPLVRKIPWRRKRQTTLVFLPGESRGQRSLVGYSPCKETDTTEAAEYAHIYIRGGSEIF